MSRVSRVESRVEESIEVSHVTMSNLAAGSRHNVAHRPSGVRGGESEEDTLLTTETVTAWVRAALHLE